MFFPIKCQEENIIVVYGKLTEGITVHSYCQLINLLDLLNIMHALMNVL